jgi:5-methylcytosine-specific restriction endonuclease McrA
MMDTLVLDHTFRPISRVSWRKAFGWMWTGRVEVVEAYSDKLIHSATQSWPMPSIVRFVTKVKGYFRKGVQFNRKNVYLRDKGRCQYCGNKVRFDDYTNDHVIPSSKGGKTKWENIAVACLGCNQRKADRTPEQAGMKLLRKPVRPKSLPGGGVMIQWHDHMPESWKDWISTVSYWTEPLS